MSNRLEVPQPRVRVPLGLVCGSFARFVNTGVPPAPLPWADRGLEIGVNIGSCFTSLTDPVIPIGTGVFTCPNNTTRVNWSAGNWNTIRAPGTNFGASDSAGPFTTSAGSFYNNIASLARVNALISDTKSLPLVPYTAPTWPVWLARGLGVSMDVPTGGVVVDTLPFNYRQGQYLWGSADGLIVHPDDQEFVSTWTTVSFNVPCPGGNSALGSTVADAYIGTTPGGGSAVARGLVVDLTNWLPTVNGVMRLGGYAIRS